MERSREDRVIVSEKAGTTRDAVDVWIERDGKTVEEAFPYQHAFVLVGAELPVKFLKSLGIKLENEWEGSFLRAAAMTLTTLAGVWFVHGQTDIIGSIS